MDELSVRITRLEPMRVAATLGFGPNPEIEAWEKLLKWASAHGLLDRPHRFFGFNNPNPVPGSPDYGYEQWMTIGSEVDADADVEIKNVEGGLYAVLPCNGIATITEDWGRLFDWVEAGPHQIDDRPCLEELLTPPERPYEEYVFDLYLAITD